MNDKLREYEQHMKRLETAYEERIHAIDQERDQVAAERDQLIITLRTRNEEAHNAQEEA